ncbi:MAG: ketopantoate reductase family protein [Candidatus Eremiobacteraeota bacterium]|nr:ketopantoate reductase family protein [Candidatus Eremiobacteraeota bacterium]
MKFYIVGRGAVGTYFGDMLESAGVEVAYAPRALSEVTPFDADAALVATKAYDTEAAIETLRKGVVQPEKCAFISPQNGVGNEERLAAAFGPNNVIAAALTTPVDRDRDGRAKAANEGGLALAPMGSNAYNWLVAAFSASGMNVKVVDDWRALKWSKLALNVVANASCAILNVLPNRLVHYEKIFTLEIRMIREVRAVMSAMRLQPIDLPRYPIRTLFNVAGMPSPVARALMSRSVAGARGTKPPSLLLDLRRGRPQTEVDVLNGAVASAGRELGLTTPVNAVYARVLDDIAHTPPLWAKYRERPETLEAEVEAEVRRAKALVRR